MARLDFRGVSSGGAVSYGSNATSVGDANAGGASTTVSRSDHVHSGATLSYGSNSNEVGATSAAGASTSVSRADHVHRGVFEITSSTSNTMTQRTINLRAGGNVGFGLDTSTNTLTISTAATGGSTFSYASNSNDVGTADAPGASTLVSRADHVHRGVYEVTASSSNTLAQRTVNLRPGTGIALGVSADNQTVTISNIGGGAGGGSVSFGSNANSVGEENSGGASSLASRADHVHKGIGSGTLFPVSPATNDRFFRTDLGLDCYYDGTRWLTVNEYRADLTAADIAPQNVTTTGAWLRAWIGDTTYDKYVTTWYTGTYVSTTNNGSNYYSILCRKLTTASSATNLVSFNTSADSANVWVDHSGTVGATLGTTYPTLDVNVSSKTGTPGNLRIISYVLYRLVVT